MELLAHGCDNDVFSVGRGRVLRRYRDPSRTVDTEARVMEYARRHGVPVPEVFDADGTDLVMEKIDGPTLGTVFARTPWRMAALASQLAEIHRIVHEVPGPAWLDQPTGPGTSLVHLDLHPQNVVLGADGAFVIDWGNAATGPGEADVADAWLVMRTAGNPGSRIRRTIAPLAQRLFAERFLRATHADIGPVVSLAASRRVNDPDLNAADRARILRLTKLAPPTLSTLDA
jgi:aminoglycoside phosphotransferase (APT) family kinase protein